MHFRKRNIGCTLGNTPQDRFLGACSAFYRLSPAPQAEPQAAGFSAGLSPAPQAEPQAAGFSAGLSPAPQAEPQAAGFSAGLSPVPQAVAGAASGLLFQPKRLERAMIVTSKSYSVGVSPSVLFILLGILLGTSTHYFITQSPFCDFCVFVGDFDPKRNLSFLWTSRRSLPLS